MPCLLPADAYSITSFCQEQLTLCLLFCLSTGRGGAPWGFAVQRREDIAPELFAVLAAPSTLRVLWHGPGRAAPAPQQAGAQEWQQPQGRKV